MVRFDGWSEGGLEKQRNDGGGCVAMHERSERVESPFFSGLMFFRTALPCSGGNHLERGGTPLHDAVRINCKEGGITKNQGADVNMGEGVYFDDCVCVCVCVCDLT